MTSQVAKTKSQALGKSVALHDLRLLSVVVSLHFTVLAQDNS